MRLFPSAVLVVAGIVAALAFPREARLAWQAVAGAIVSPTVADTPQVAAEEGAAALIRAAEAQVGVTTVYDGAYVALAFPGGDVPPERGVCTDVLVRALRVAHGIDLQVAVNADMRVAFADYPPNWGLSGPDRNIDHRRVPNLARLLQRIGAEVALPQDPAAFRPGDVVTSMLPGNLPHVMIVTDRTGHSGALMVVHNIGAGTRIEDRLFDHPLTGHFRLTPEVLERLRDLQG
jgi:hypothetical protein